MSGLMLCLAAEAAIAGAASNPYQSIAQFNVFRLQLQPLAHTDKPPPPIAKITLNGTTSLLGNKRALLTVLLPAQPSGGVTELSLILAEGQRDGQIEVLQIDERTGTVKVNNFGTVMAITFENATANQRKP